MEPESTELTNEERVDAQAVASGSKGLQVVEVLGSILDAMDFDAKPELVSETAEEIQVDIVGASEDLGRLIGRHGLTLDALQYLVGIAVNHGSYSKTRVLLDAEGYRVKHQQLLEERVLDIAAKVSETSNEAVLEPQNARDRRIVHVVLADNPDVYTYSEGEGDDRHVVISPKK
jgi:spoIIIJ-associated protein